MGSQEPDLGRHHRRLSRSDLIVELGGPQRTVLELLTNSKILRSNYIKLIKNSNILRSNYIKRDSNISLQALV